jgi:hypothetical protein
MAEGDPIGGGEPRPIPRLGDDLVPVGWTDKADVLFARPRGVGRLCPVYRIDLSNGRSQLFRELGPADPSGSPTVYSVVLTPDGRSYAYSLDWPNAELFTVSGVLGAR